MNPVIFGAAVIVAAIGVALICFFRRVSLPDRERVPNLEWCNQFTVQRYRPMERLFSQDDVRFLMAQPGCSPRLLQRLRAERRRIFRHYLRCLKRDFNRLHTAARFLLLASPQDRPDLVTALFRQRMEFRLAMATLHGQLVLESLGLATVDVRRLVASLEAMGSRFRELAVVPQRVAA